MALKKEITFEDGLKILENIARGRIVNIALARMLLLADRGEYFFGHIPSIKFFRNKDHSHHWAEIDGMIFDLYGEFCFDNKEEYKIELTEEESILGRDLWDLLIDTIPEDE
jgi:5'-deoxynucleotidase YfbR-like HD superfamily hydrolase